MRGCLNFLAHADLSCTILHRTSNLPESRPVQHIHYIIHCMGHEMDIQQQVIQLLQQWQAQLWHFLPNVLSAVLILILFWLLALGSRWVSVRFDHRLTRSHVRVGRIVGWLAYGFFLISGVFLALDALHLTQFLTHMLAGAGIVGIVAGFAFKDIASNAFAGMLVNIQRPFTVGDWVEMDGVFGRVKTISLLTTAMEDVTGQMVYVPNHLIYNDCFKNYSTTGKWRVVIACGAGSTDDLARVQSVALDEVAKISQHLPDEPMDVCFKDISAAGCHFDVRFWIAFETHEQYLATVSEAVARLKSRFQTENISLL